MKYVAFMALEKGQFRELSHFELKSTISEGKTYYVVKVNCTSIKEYEQIRFLDNATITLKAEITGVFRTNEGELSARVAYREFSTSIADADIEMRFTIYHSLDESEIQVIKMEW